MILGVLTTVLGGILLTVSALSYFLVFFGTLFSKPTMEPELSFPTSEAYHDEKKIGWLGKLTPWVIIAAIIIVIAYVPAIKQSIDNTNGKAPMYSPDSPVPLIEQTE